MVAPLVGAALVGAAGSLIGGAISNRNARKQQEQNAALQREFAQQGIRWKVDDARAAGLHPLYAMGAAGSTYTPTTYSDAMGPAVAQASQQYGRVAAEKQRRHESGAQRNIQRDQIILGQQRLQSQIRVDEAQANYYNAMAAQALRQPSSGFGEPNVQTSEPGTAQTGEYVVKPTKVPAANKGDPSQVAGPDSPAWMDVRLGNLTYLPPELQTLRVPRTDEGWAEEFMEKIPVIAAANAARYYKWLSSDSIAAMYMSPYGRVKLLAMAARLAPQMFKNLKEALYRTQKPKKAPGYDANWRGGFSGTGEF